CVRVQWSSGGRDFTELGDDPLEVVHEHGNVLGSVRLPEAETNRAEGRVLRNTDGGQHRRRPSLTRTAGRAGGKRKTAHRQDQRVRLDSVETDVQIPGQS